MIGTRRIIPESTRSENGKGCATMFVDEQYTYCEVLPANYQTSWSYICDFEISPGKFVVVPIRSENREKVALVLSVRRCSEGDAPYPPHSTKHILRVFGENEPGELQLQKKALISRLRL